MSAPFDVGERRTTIALIEESESLHRDPFVLLPTGERRVKYFAC
jgi:hypothetical protein